MDFAYLLARPSLEEIIKMAGDPAFKQLVEMGIPGGRARAALKKSHNDVMAAAVSRHSFSPYSTTADGNRKQSSLANTTTYLQMMKVKMIHLSPQVQGPLLDRYADYSDLG